MSIPLSKANVPLTAEQASDLELMTNPSRWIVPNLLAMQKVEVDPKDSLLNKVTPGTLVYANMVNRFVFWPGLSFHNSPHKIQKFMTEHESSGPLHPMQLEALIRDGWEVD